MDAYRKQAQGLARNDSLPASLSISCPFSLFPLTASHTELYLQTHHFFFPFFNRNGSMRLFLLLDLFRHAEKWKGELQETPCIQWPA